MLSRPDIPRGATAGVLDRFGLRNTEADFLPSGDANSAVFNITADGARYFLKLRCGDFDETAATVPAYLHSSGITRVMAPIPAATGQPWIHSHGFDWMLYPFFAGKNGFDCPLSKAQWIELGETMRQVHSALLPSEIAQRLPRASYSSRFRTIVMELDRLADRPDIYDPSAAQLAAFWTEHRGEIRLLVERADQLAPIMRQRDSADVLCHTDLHAGNVLVGADGQLTIVDWDNPIFAPRERDLMFVGAGIGGTWNDPKESDWFYAGYGPADIDPIAIAFYRYERIVVDIAEYGQSIFGLKGNARDRQSSFHKLTDQLFLANNVVDMAHKSYSNLS